jgi:hypothetical protein
LQNASWLSYEAVRWALQLEAPALPNSLAHAGSH